MIFTKINPSEQLRHLVNYFWWIGLDCEKDDTDSFSERILPDASSEIVFHFGDRVSRSSGDNGIQCEPNCFFAGPNTSYYNLAARGVVSMIGVKFYPHTPSFLLRENAKRLRDSVVDLAAIWGDAINRVHERLAEAETLETRIALIENFLNGCLRDRQSFPVKYLDFAVRHVTENHGRVTFPRLAQKLGITPRYLEKLFLEHVGIQPKLFAEIVQLRQSVRLMNLHKNRSLTDISYASGYYDQSHHIRAFKRFTGLTPSQLRQETIVTQQPFLDSKEG